MRGSEEDLRGEVHLLLRGVRRYLEDLIAFEGPYFLALEKGEPEEERPRMQNEERSEAADGGAPSVDEPGLETEERNPAAEELEALRREVLDCVRCPLAKSRKNVVFGAGDPEAGILFVGEAPGAEEDQQGEPFVGAAGQLLTRIIEAMGMHREEVYICNVLKCRPPGNRTPLPEEIAQCEPHLKRQIEIVRPRIICALGRVAAQTLLKSAEPLGRLRGRLHQYEGIPVIVTYHPAALLRNPQWKRPTWEDVKRLRREYDGVEL